MRAFDPERLAKLMNGCDTSTDEGMHLFFQVLVSEGLAEMSLDENGEPMSTRRRGSDQRGDQQKGERSDSEQQTDPGRSRGRADPGRLVLHQRPG